MPGNEAPEHIHNFFEQDNSSQGHQSHAGGRNWPFLNNPWVDTQTQNGIPPTFNSNNYVSQSVDTERRNGVQSIQTPLGTNPTRSSLKPELIRSQSRNQQINHSGYMHGSQDLQASPIQPDFQGDGTISDSYHNLPSRSFSSFEPHHSAPVYSSGLARSSERPEATEAPVSFDFLGGQQIMRNQQQGINEMELWQQHLMFKRLQETQRQLQLQQLRQRGMHNNSPSEFSGIARQGTNDQVPGLLSGMPINKASSYMRSNELMGSELKLPSSSHMLHSANMSWAQRSGSSIQGDPNGIKLLHDQGQVIRSKGLVPQQPDQSLYGTPIASIRGSLAHPSQFQGTAHDFTSTENLAENALKQSSAFNYVQGGQYSVPTQGYLQDGVSLTNQGTQGKSVFENAPVQSESGGATSGSFQQLNHFSPSVQAQEVEQVGFSPGVASLDPTEERLSFSEDEGNQLNLFGGNNHRGTGGYLHENPSQSYDYLSAFPSIQSGSWSALMQEAVEASSSDIGLNEEWSGLSLQKMELSSGNHSTVLNANNGKQPAPLGDGICKNASSLGSTPFPLFNDSEGSPNCHATPTSQTANFSYQQGERISSGTFHESFQQCSNEPNDKSFDQQKQCVEGSSQMQPQFNNTSHGVWAGRMHEEPASSAHSAEFNHQNTQHLWIQQQKVPLHSVNNHSTNKSSGWNVEAVASSGGNASKTNNNDEKKQHSMNMEREHGGNMLKYGGSRVAASFSNSAGGQERVKSDTGSPVMHNEGSYTCNLAANMDSSNLKLSQETDQQLLNRQQSDYGKHVADTFLKNKIEKYQNQRSSSPQAWGSPMGYTDRTSSEPLLKKENSYPKELPNERFNARYLVSQQNAERGGAAGKNYFLARNDPHPLGNSSLTSGQDGRGNLGPRRFPFYTMGDSEISMEPMNSQNNTSCSQGSSQPGVLGLKNQEQGYVVRTQFDGHAANSSLDMGKEHLTDLKRNARAAEEIQSRSSFLNQPSMPSPDGATSQFLQNKRSDVTSENMLELLHKVDQSRVGNAVTRFGFSAHNAASKMPDADVPDGSSSHLQRNQFALHGISLKLAPPCQRQSLSECALPSQTALQQTANAFEQRNPDSGLREKVQTWSLSPTSVPSLPPDEASLEKKIGDRSLTPGNRGNVSMNSNSQGNSLESSSYTLRMNQSQMHQQQQEQQQQQQISSATGPTPSNQSANPPVSKGDASSKQPFHSVKGHKSHMEAIDQSAEASLASAVGRAPPTRFTPSTDNSASVASKFYPVSAGNSQPTMSSAHFRSSNQHNAAVETRTAAQPPGTSAMSQQSGFSNMLHNVWTNVSSQRRVSGMQPQKIISNVLQSMSPLPSSREANLQKPQRAENHNKRKGESVPSEQGENRLVKDASSQEMPPPERVSIEPKTGSASLGQEADPKHHSDGMSAVSLSSLGHLHQQDLIRRKHSQIASHETHKGYDSRPTIISSSNHNTGGPYGHSLGSSDVQKQNYSLLQQLQTMKGVDSDPSKRAVKKLKGPDFVSESLQKDWAAGHRYVYGQNTTLREMGTNSQNSSLSSDVRMLSFASRENEGKSSNTSVQDDGEEAPSQDQVINKHHDINTHTLPHGKSSPIAFVGGGDRPQISPQMAPSWFKQYDNFKKGQISTTNNVVENLQRSAKAAGQHHFSNFSESMNQDIVPEQRYEANQVGSIRNDTSPSLQHDISPAPVGASHSLASPYHPAFEASNNNMVLVPKKRKSATDDFLPWHKEVTEGCQRLQSISVAESDWARATNRLVDKVEDEFEMIEDVFPVSRARRRLILTNQLMQQILPSVPAAFLAADVTTSCESVTYFCAKIALRDACSLVSCSGGDSRMDLDNGNMGSGKLKTSEEEGENNLAKAAENFIGRSRKLENDFLSLDRRASILDLRLECQELERSSIMNRFAKFHVRAQTEGVESSSTTGTAPRRTFPQRHVTALALCTNLPEGVTYLSL